MMRKNVSRLLALVLVLCMVVLCVPVRAQAAVNLTRPENITDEEWEVLRQKLLAQLAAEQAAKQAEEQAEEQAAKQAEEQATTRMPVTEETLPETDSLSRGETGNLTVTDEAKTPSGIVTDQTVSVELPAQADTIKEETVTDDSGTKDIVTNEYDTTIEVEKPNGKTEETEVTVKESYDLEATVKDVQTEGSGSQNITDITYEISLDGSVSAEDAEGNDVIESNVVKDIDAAANQAAEEEQIAAPQFKVDMTVNGMVDDPTRVEHKYTVTRKVTNEAGVEEDKEVEETEYYYNAANGIDEQDTGKKYFTVSVVEKVKEGADTVKDKVVSLWTSFLGIFHITNDAFENQDTKEMSSDLASAVNGAEKGETVEMLRDYTTDEAADITTAKDVTVDLNGHVYTSTDAEGNAAIKVTGNDQSLTIKDGFISSVKRAINVLGNRNTVKVADAEIDSGFRGVQVTGSGNTVTVDRTVIDSKDIGVSDFNANNKITVKDSVIDSNSSDFGIYHSGNYGGADISVIGSYVYADGATGAGIYISGSKNLTKNNKLTIKDSDVRGETGVEVKFTDVTIDNSYLLGFGVPSKYTANNNGSTTVGAALAVTDNGDGVTGGTIVINSGWFEGSKDINNIYLAAKKNASDPQASVTVKGGRFTNAAGLYDYIGAGYAAISHNDGSDFPYEVVTRDYTPTREGYRFLGYTDANGNAITLAEAYRKGVVAFAQWKAIPETPAKTSPLIAVKTDEKGCTTKVTTKGDTAYVTVKNAKGEPAPISEVTITSIQKLQAKDIDTIEIQVDEDVTLVLDIEKAKENGFTDSIEVTLEKDILLIASGKKTCIELDIGVLKAADKPVEIQLVEGKLTVMLGKSSSLTVDLTNALKIGKRIVVKLENGVLKLYDQYNKPIKET